MTSDKNPVEDRLQSLIDFAKTVDLEEVVWEKGPNKIAFRRRMNGADPEPAALPVAEVQPVPEKKTSLHYVTSPLVGSFWRGVSRDRPPLVIEGDDVKPGQRLAFVEAMKVQKEVISDVKGKIVRIMVENSKPVEYGQRIFEIEAKD